MKKLRPGGWAWIGLGVGIASADYWLLRNGHDPMSAVFGDAIQHPIKRWPVVAAWTYITLHLFGRWLPKRFKLYRLDPLGLAANHIHPKIK
jgi:hypothetical protein